MAKRDVRKVSRSNTRNQKKETTLDKKWIAVISCVLIVLIGLGIGLGIYFGTKSKTTEAEDYVSSKIYFSEPTKTSANQEVEFKKDNYQAIKRYIKSGNHAEHIFVFVYDGASFYADKEDENRYQEDYDRLITYVADLQYAVNKAKEHNVQVELYIIDVNVNDRVNTGIYSDSSFGAVQSDSSSSFSPALIYLKDGEYQKEIKKEDNTKLNLEYSSWKEIMQTLVPNFILYIDSLE